MNSPFQEFEAEIPSNFESGQALVERVMSIVESSSFSTREVFGIRLAVDEAVANAIKHGNKQSPDKLVRLKFCLNHQGVRVEIEDQGDGFHPEDVPDPTAEENLERPCGRGLMLMREFMTKIEYNSKGNLVILEKHIPS